MTLWQAVRQNRIVEDYVREHNITTEYRMVS